MKSPPVARQERREIQQSGSPTEVETSVKPPTVPPPRIPLASNEKYRSIMSFWYTKDAEAASSHSTLAPTNIPVQK
jgi:hypothetical protein